MAKTYSADEIVNQIPPEKLEAFKQALLAQTSAEGTGLASGQGSVKGLVGKAIIRGLSAFGEGATLGFQGRPISEHSAFNTKATTADEINKLIATEKLKNILDPSKRTEQLELDEIVRKKAEQGNAPPDKIGTATPGLQVDSIDTNKVEELRSGEDKEPPVEYIPKGVNKFGIMEYEIDDSRRKAWLKAQEKISEDAAGAKKSISGTRDFIRDYAETRDELLKSGYKNIGEATGKGLTQRIGATIQEKTGTLPKTTAFINRLKVIANKTARDVEGGRVTDQDREVYANAMANAIRFPDETNISLVSKALRDLKNRGGNIEPVLSEFENSGVELFQSMAAEVRRLDSTISDPSKQKIGRFEIQVE